MCSEVAKARRHIRDSRAGGQQDRVREEQKQEGASTPAGQEKRERACDEPADEAASGLDARVVSHTGVSA